MRKIAKYSWAIMLLIIVAQISSCKKDEKEPDVIAKLTFAADANNYKIINFTSTAQNFASLSWNFGDNSAVSAETNPVHTYAAIGDYNVTLTATSPGGVTDVYTEKITVADPNAYLTSLVGDVSKTWKALRKTGNGRYPLECGPATRSTIWWAFGLNNDLALRTCLLNDEWKFTRAGLKMDLDLKGDYWAEGGVFKPAEICASTSSMKGPADEDLSKWGGGSFTFVLTPGTTPKLQVVGLGAYIGLCKVASTSEVKLPQASVTYDVIKLTDGVVDTLVVQTSYTTGDNQAAYWRFVLVHYDNTADEPVLPGPKPSAGYTVALNGLTATFTNTSTDGVTFAWDFGDGTTSTAQNPTKTYTAGGPYVVKLTATNPNGAGSTQKVVFATTDVLTDALLQGNAWKVRAEEMSVFVGPGLGDASWWALPKSFMVSGTGGDDWTCFANDEFKFLAGGVYSFDTKGSTRNDGYFGGTNGCIDDAGIAASGNGAAFGTCATHTYLLTPANGTTKATIKLTNAAGKAAFLGFYKGYNGVASSVAGGENGDKTKPANGGSATNTYTVMGFARTATKDYLYVSVDISDVHSGGAAWSIILTR